MKNYTELFMAFTSACGGCSGQLACTSRGVLACSLPEGEQVPCSLPAASLAARDCDALVGAITQEWVTSATRAVVPLPEPLPQAGDGDLPDDSNCGGCKSTFKPQKAARKAA